MSQYRYGDIMEQQLNTHFEKSSTFHFLLKALRLLLGGIAITITTVAPSHGSVIRTYDLLADSAQENAYMNDESVRIFFVFSVTCHAFIKF
ncbi:hypothetical protein EVAR_58964_1 [Eumeta japonica]|uniref:Uncharacterized protein n=1 Tax=Eumeta variegata TaxID=151549 RepID=A0A4C1YF68_EUMVA|nr:hypothetical protein EVAR_58964_1 [Eumeta japonica]